MNVSVGRCSGGGADEWERVRLGGGDVEEEGCRY